MIRMLELGDREAWTRLWTDYLRFYETTLSEALFDTTWGRLNDPAEPMWGALALDEDGTPIGLVHYIYHRTAWAIGDTCYLQDLYVDPAFRGGGHGRALIGHVAEAAKAAGAVRVYWHTNEANATARRLYDAVAVYSGFVQYQIKL
ncbi:MAG: GNAT family N-acetyltransferase [Hyphomicrobiales bacterium]|nr:MAG: GNAT family N-acetyltransferase [Hyphomicrobiales bacterium]